MLFNDDYMQSDYEYRYTAETNPLCVPRIASTRIQVYPGSSEYLNLDPDGSNIFALQAHDFATLDALLAYRNDGTALTIIDSTSVEYISDATAGIFILYASLDSLSTQLSKMIYLYLILMLYDRYEEYNNEVLISMGGLIQTCYESYLIDQYFCFMTERNPDLIADCD